MASHNGIFSPTQSEIEESTAARLRGSSITSEDRQTLRSERSHKSHRSHKSQRQGSIMNPSQRGSVVETGNGSATAGIPYGSLGVTSPNNEVTSDSAEEGATYDLPLTVGTDGLQQQEDQPQLTAHRASTASALGASSKRGSTASALGTSSKRGSTASALGASSKRGSTALPPKARFDVVRAIFYQADTNHDGLISREEFQQWALPGIIYSDADEPSQTLTRSMSQSSARQSLSGSQTPTGQLPPRAYTPAEQTSSGAQTPTQQTENNVLNGQDASNDSALNIDYGAVEAYNVAMRSSVDITGMEGPPSTGARASTSSTLGSTQKKFDVAKAIFNQADTNHDGSISREEFREWATPGLIKATGPYAGVRASVGNASVHRNSVGYGSGPRISIRNGSVPRNSIGNASAPRHSIGNASMPRNSTVGNLAMPRNSVGNASVHRNSIRNGSVPRNSVGNISAPRQSVGNASMPRNSTVGNLSMPRNSVGNVSLPRQSVGNISAPRQSIGNMSAPRQSVGNASAARNSVGHFSMHRDSMGHFLQPRASFGSVSNPGQAFNDENHDPANDQQQGDLGEGALNYG